MKKLIFGIFLMLFSISSWAQSMYEINGRVVDEISQKPLQNVTASLANTNQSVFTDVNGKFTITIPENGSQRLILSFIGYSTKNLPFEIELDQKIDLGTITLSEDITSELQLSLVTLTENDLGDDNSGSENTSGLLQASRDAFQQVAAFNWGQARFRVRGLDNEYGNTFINGISMNKVYDGRPQYSNWGGLNDATRNQEFTTGSNPSDYTFGGILGTQSINMRASAVRAGNRFSVSGANTNYSMRTMFTHGSGLNKNGWAYAVSASYRGAKEAFFEGTDYDAKSIYAAVEKKFNDEHSLNLTAVYAQNKRGKNSPNTQEVIDLKGYKYNSYWGYQDGEKRNSRYKEVEQPLFILSHDWKISEKSKLNTNVGYQFGRIANSRLDYNNGRNPDPTYYRNLPSYYLTDFDSNGNFLGNNPENLQRAQEAKDQFLADGQINWNDIYRQNRDNVESATILYEDVTYDNQLSFNTNFSTQLDSHITLEAGINYTNLKSQNYQEVVDLLGGEFYSDKDTFLQGEAQQSNLNTPNRLVTVGDKFGYNYILRANILEAFAQAKFNYSDLDYYFGIGGSYSAYQRDGIYRNGNYPDNSEGKSKNVNFENYGVKGGITYRITGRHILNANAAYLTKAPTLRNTFPNARMNNTVVNGINSETVASFDASYIVRTPKLKGRITGFYSQITDATDIGFYFAEGLGTLGTGEEKVSGNGNAFVSEVVTGINKQNMGVELGIEYQLTPTIKATAAATYGQYIYNGNQNVTLNIDNTRATVDFGEATMKNYKQAGMPNQAYSIGLEYRDPNYWWIGANVNYIGGSYVDISPLLRTENFLINPDDADGFPFAEATPDNVRRVLKQEKLKDFTLVNLSGGKSWRVKGNTLGFFASINNIFDVQYKTGGFEQGRNANYGQVTQDMTGSVRAFGPKYFYGYGRTFFLNLYINF
nr:TonB-dependent receptor [uncultured Flavobacterium sp.]